MRVPFAILLLSLCGCGESPCQKLDDRCAVCSKTPCNIPDQVNQADPQTCVEGCKELATLLSDSACNDVILALKASDVAACPYPLDIETVILSKLPTKGK